LHYSTHLVLVSKRSACELESSYATDINVATERSKNG
jgi:hypothetical protein